MAVDRQVVLLISERLPFCDPYLLRDEIEAGDLLRDRMLNLQARVHLHKVKAVVAVEQELDRSRIHISASAGSIDGRGTHRRAKLRRDSG